MMTMKIDTQRAEAALRSKSKALEGSLKLNMAQAGEAFIGDIQTNQMSGRPGLRRQTGNLVKSWFERVTGSIRSDIILRIGTRTKYAAVHEYGTQKVPAHSVRAHVRKSVVSVSAKGRRKFSRANVRAHMRKAHTRTFPKRLRVRARWQQRGLRLFVRSILRSYRELSQ